MKWVPVTDKLPEHLKNVLLKYNVYDVTSDGLYSRTHFADSLNIAIGYYVDNQSATYRWKFKSGVDGGDINCIEITHWMEIPD